MLAGYSAFRQNQSKSLFAHDETVVFNFISRDGQTYMFIIAGHRLFW